MNSNTKILFLDCGMGVAGDMLSAALYDLLNEEDKQTFLNLTASLNLKGVEIIPEKVSKTGISGTQLQVLITDRRKMPGFVRKSTGMNMNTSIYMNICISMNTSTCTSISMSTSICTNISMSTSTIMTTGILTPTGTSTTAWRRSAESSRVFRFRT